MKTRRFLILAVAAVAMLAWGQQALAQGGSAMWDRFWGGRMCPSGSSNSNYRPSGSSGYYQPSSYQRGGYQGYQQSYQQGYRPNYSPPRYSSGGYWGGGRSGGVSVNVGDLFSPRYGSYGGYGSYGSDGSPSVIFVEAPRQEPMTAGPIIVQQPPAPQFVQQVPQMQQMPFPPMPPQIIVIQQPPPAQPQIIQQPVQAPMAPQPGPIVVVMGAPAPAAKDANAPTAVAIGDSEETLLRQFATSEDGSRKKVAKKLAKFPTSLRVKMILIEALIYDQDEDVRQEAAKTLGKMKARMALDALQQVADGDKDDDVKEAAAEAIEKIRERPEPPIRRGPAPPPPPLVPLPRTPAPTTSPS